MTDPLTFADTTPRLALPLLFAGQAQKEVTVNEALARIDLALQCVVEGECDVPPGAPAVGETWLVGAGATGAFAGHTGEIAGWSAGGWRFVVPAEGLRVFDRGTGCFRLFRDAWTAPGAPPVPVGGSVIDTEARAAISNLLATLAEAGLFATS